MNLLYLFTSLLLLYTANTQPPNYKWPLPWKENVAYEFEWYEGKLVGKSRFQLSWSPDRAVIACKGSLTFFGRDSYLTGTFSSAFAPDMSPLLHVSRFKGGTAGISGGGAGAIAAFTPSEIRVKLGTTKDGLKKTFPRPKDTRFWLCGHQAIHHWALFLPMVDTEKPTTISVFMPEFLGFATIALTPEGKEETRGTMASRLAFRLQGSTAGTFSGKVWLDQQGRLLRYQQKHQRGTLDIWIREENL